MISPFEFFGVGRIVFGRGKFSSVGEIAATLGERPLIVYNGDQPGHGGAVDQLSRLESSTLFRQRGEPTVSDIDTALLAAREAKSDCVIAIGGGSAIDAGKAIAALLANGGEALDYMEVVGRGKKITRPSFPLLAIPTTAGTGAEVTRNAVIGVPEKKFKASIRSELMLPRVALIDPELGTKVPADVTAASGMDAICQLIESYTSTHANSLTDTLSLNALAGATQSLQAAFADGSDTAARTQMAFAALTSGITLTSAGLGAVHGFAAPLGANFPIPHGVVCAALLPHVVEANCRALSESGGDERLMRYAMLARIVAKSQAGPVNVLVESLVNHLRELGNTLRIPRLGTFGLKRDAIPDMVALARNASSMRYNPVVLSDETLRSILQNAL